MSEEARGRRDVRNNGTVDFQDAEAESEVRPSKLLNLSVTYVFLQNNNYADLSVFHGDTRSVE